MNKKFRIAIVGCGGMGSGHAVALQSGTGETVYKGNVADAKMPDSAMTTSLGEIAELAGITDIDSERIEWAVSQGISVYTGYEELLADKTVDAVLIATPNHLHKPMAISALRAGKHVLCEKPV
ncbi:MAG: Gfo/Idh/MocA family oxidoreductase, partial [Acutalibacter sp.]|uniref:Gfo/Idh/MocA family protein n=1 Tax=Acutalibacter sp. TaxID=1918636 RepID=UPI00217014C2